MFPPRVHGSPAEGPWWHSSREQGTSILTTWALLECNADTHDQGRLRTAGETPDDAGSLDSVQRAGKCGKLSAGNGPGSVNEIRYTHALDGDRVIHVLEAAYLVRDRYICPAPGCGGFLMAVAGEAQHVRPRYFRHQDPTRCNLDSYLHSIAVLLLEQRLNEDLRGEGGRSAVAFRAQCPVCQREFKPMRTASGETLRVVRTHRLPSGATADVAVCEGDEVRFVIDVHRSSRPPVRDRLGSLRIPWVQLRQEPLIETPLRWRPTMVGNVTCTNCAEVTPLRSVLLGLLAHRRDQRHRDVEMAARRSLASGDVRQAARAECFVLPPPPFDSFLAPCRYCRARSFRHEVNMDLTCAPGFVWPSQPPCMRRVSTEELRSQWGRTVIAGLASVLMSLCHRCGAPFAQVRLAAAPNGAYRAWKAARESANRRE